MDPITVRLNTAFRNRLVSLVTATVQFMQHMRYMFCFFWIDIKCYTHTHTHTHAHAYAYMHMHNIMHTQRITTMYLRGTECRVEL